jgi:hypothetical protein
MEAAMMHRPPPPWEDAYRQRTAALIAGEPPGAPPPEPGPAAAGNAPLHTVKEEPAPKPEPEPPPTLDAGAALGFLDRFLRGEPALLVAINPFPPREAEVRYFKTRDGIADQLREWTSRKLNIYFTVNRTPGTKRKKGDITAARAFHADYDPKSPEGIEAWRAGIVEKLRAFVPPPSCIVSSGRGVQAFWLLREPIPVGASNIGKLEACNEALADALGGDHCKSIEHIMRLPGTVNVAGPTKLDKGFAPYSQAKLLHMDETRLYELVDFERLLPKTSERKAGKSGADAHSEGAERGEGAAHEEPPRINLDDIPQLKSHPKLRQLLETAELRLRLDPERKNEPYKSRSEAGLAVIRALLTLGVGEPVIRAIFLGARIGKYAREKPDPDAFMDREIAKAVVTTREPAAGEPPYTQADRLMRGAMIEAELFRDKNGVPYADIVRDGHRETWPVEGGHFRDWFANRSELELGHLPARDALRAALEGLEAKARTAPTVREVHLRVGEHDGKLYLDLCNDAWQAVEIDAAGWRVADAPPLRFRRVPGMLALPVPAEGGRIEELRDFLNLTAADDLVMLASWLMAALGPPPYPVLVLAGEQGTAKSTTAYILRQLIDPNSLKPGGLPHTAREMHVAADNGHVLAFDNLSDLTAPLSDILCRLSDGGGFTTRKNYTDRGVELFKGGRPIILNGIEDIVTRGDLVSRSIFLTLEPIQDTARKTEAELLADFAEARPRLLGALLRGVATGLARLPGVKLTTMPRLADFARWGVACETAFWAEDTFKRAYRTKLAEGGSKAIAASPEGTAVLALLETSGGRWSGTATRLLDALAAHASEGERRDRGWPKSANALSGRLRRLAPDFRG